MKKYVSECLPCWNLSPKHKTGLDRDVEIQPLEPKLQPWLADAQAFLGGGVRSHNMELVVYWANLVTQGVMTAAKQTFLVQAMQNAAATSPHSFVGVIVMPNRACDLRERKPLPDIHKNRDESVFV